MRTSLKQHARSLILCLSGAVAVATLSGCMPRRLPGTDIEDTVDSRAVLDVLTGYTRAMEGRDARGVMRLVSRDFRDDGGTGSPQDDLDHGRLEQVLPERLSRVEDLRLDITVKKMTFEDGGNTADVVYFYQASFRLPAFSNKPKNESGLKKMILHKEDAGWKLVSGI